MAVPITIITGFLGSGKTTLLQNLLRKSTKKLAILMNEFGAVDIDAKIIRGKNVNIIELAGGCVCCSMAGEFEAAVREILEKYSPDHIVVETTGVAEPDALALDVQSLPGVELDAIICIADADSLVKFPSIGHTSRKQIEIADLILLNKTDLVEDSDIKEIIKKLEKLNKKAEIIPVQNCEIEPELVLGLEVGEREIEKPKIHAPEFVSYVYENSAMNDRAVEEFVITVDAIRIKGFVYNKKETFLFNCVNGRCSVEGFDNLKKTQLVFIGRKLDNEKIKAGLDKCKI